MKRAVGFAQEIADRINQNSDVPSSMVLTLDWRSSREVAPPITDATLLVLLIQRLYDYRWIISGISCVVAILLGFFSVK